MSSVGFFILRWCSLMDRKCIFLLFSICSFFEDVFLFCGKLSVSEFDAFKCSANFRRVLLSAQGVFGSVFERIVYKIPIK